MSVFFKKNYWNFLLKSSNQHGIHSPFVYNLVTLCFYKKEKKQTKLKSLLPYFPKTFTSKHVLVLYRYIIYASAKINYSFTYNKKALQQLSSFIPQTDTKKTTIIYVNTQAQDPKIIDTLFTQLANQDTLIIETPYENIEFWKQLKQHQKAQVVVDTYHLGFIFVRKEQAKEEFYIRL